MERVVDIDTDGLFLGISRGFLTVRAEGAEKGRVALDDIGALIVHGHGTTWSNTVFTRLSARAVPVVICGANHAPVACVWPLEGHHLQAARMRAQISATRPLGKRMWADIVSAKIRMQGEVLALHGIEAGAFARLARGVRSGDPGNVEAQAARRYWKLLFGHSFLRDQDGDGINGLLNYGYTVLRAITARAVCAAGLHPTIAIFHANRANAFALADDLMEPYRPLVDHLVRRLADAGETEVTAETKRQLAAITTLDLRSGSGTSPLAVHVQKLVHSVATSFETGTAALSLPDSISLDPAPEGEPDDAAGA
jgi:CRISPR-associated protein Cas1